ncbi:hypothetical protein ACC734_39800, partial [Rhizobium ruizarguesonis]
SIEGDVGVDRPHPDAADDIEMSRLVRQNAASIVEKLRRGMANPELQTLALTSEGQARAIPKTDRC